MSFIYNRYLSYDIYRKGKLREAAENGLGMRWYSFSTIVRMLVGTLFSIALLVNIISAPDVLVFTVVLALIYCLEIIGSWVGLMCFKKIGIILYFVVSMLIPVATVMVDVLSFNYIPIESYEFKILYDVLALVMICVILLPEFIYYKKRWFLFDKLFKKKGYLYHIQIFFANLYTDDLKFPQRGGVVLKNGHIDKIYLNNEVFLTSNKFLDSYIGNQIDIANHNRYKFIYENDEYNSKDNSYYHKLYIEFLKLKGEKYIKEYAK